MTHTTLDNADEAEPVSTISRPRILVVEDEAIVAMDLRMQLQACGYEVVGTVDTGVGALAAAARLQPDLVLMDILLKGEFDGIETAARIRSELDLPIVFVTANADTATVDRAAATGPHGFIVKPFQPRVVNSTIRVALEQSTRERSLRSDHDDMLILLNALDSAALIVEGDDVVFANSAAEDLLGQAVAKFVGRPWRRALSISEHDADRLTEQFEEPPQRRTRIDVERTVGRGTGRIEVEVRDDPRSRGRRLLLVREALRVTQPKAAPAGVPSFEGIVGASEAMQSVFRLVEEVARVDSTVLVHGETGTGKELVARAVHDRSPRAGEPFVAINCGGLSDELAISQLFGHVRGAFTGADSDHVGVFESAEGGTLFLDELGELSLRVQTVLLRVLENRVFSRLGETATRPTNVRIVGATNRDLELEVAENRFRSDLMYRVRVATITLPPLRDRESDVALLADVFTRELAARMGKPNTSIDEPAMAALGRHDWPGNVRELRNVVEFALVRSRDGLLRLGDLPPEIVSRSTTGVASTQRTSTTRESIERALVQSGGNRKEAARALGISRATLYRRLAEFEDDAPGNASRNS